MPEAVDDGAPFCPLAIHVDARCCAMASTAMYRSQARRLGPVGLWSGVEQALRDP